MTSDYMALLNKKEELCDDLKPYLVKMSSFGALKHPLVYDVPYISEHNALLNFQLRAKREELRQALEKGEIDHYIWLHERPHRVGAFYRVQQHLSDQDYWRILGEVWIDSENIWQNLKLWKKLLSSDRVSRLCFMDEEDRKVYEGLPERFWVYRGYTVGRNAGGLSFTLDKKKAEWFAKRFLKKGEKGRVRELLVNKGNIFAYLGGRREQEIVIL